MNSVTISEKSRSVADAALGNSKRWCVGVVCALLAVVCGGMSEAANKTWDGGGNNNNWSGGNNNNWDANVNPVAGDSLFFDGTTRLTNNNNLAASTIYSGITFNSGAGAFTITGNAVTLSGTGTSVVGTVGVILANNSTNLQTVNLNIALGTLTTGTIAATSGNFAVGGVLSGANYTAVGPNLTTLSGANTFTGVLTVASGTVRATTSASALGAGTLSFAGGALELANDTGLNFARNTTVSTSGTFFSERTTAGAGVTHTLGTLSIGAQTLTLATDATVNSGVAGLTFGAVTLSANGATFVSNSASTLLTLGAVSGDAFNFTVDGTGATTIDGVIGTTTGSLTKNGTGNLTLSAANTYTGATSLNSGTLTLSVANALSSSTALTGAAGTVLSLGGNQTIGSLAGSVNVLLGANSLTAGANGSTTSYSGTLAGSGGLTKTGTGSLTLAGANTYTGATTISAGTVSASSIVVAAGASNLGNATSAVTLGAAGTEGTLSYTGNSATYTRGFTIGGAGGGRLDVTTAGQTLTIATGTVGGTGMFTVGGSGNTSFTAALGHTGSLTKVGSGTLTLTAASTYSGSNVLSAGTVRLTSTTGLGVGGATDEVILSGARLELAADTATTFGADIGYDSVVSASSTIAIDRTTAGAAVQHQMGVLTIGSQTLSIAAGANVTSGTATLAIAGQTVLTGSPTFDVAANTQLLLNGAISGTTDITKTGSGILTLTAGSGHANTTVSAGQLNVNFMSALGISTGTLSLAAGTSIGSTATSAVTVTNPKSIVLGSSLSFVGPTNLNLGTGTTTLTTSSTINVSTGTFTLGGNVVGSGLGITKTGTGTLVLSGLTAGAYTGNTTISDGELFLDGSSVLAGGTSTVVTVGSTAFLRIGASASTGSTTIVSRPDGVITSAVVNANVVFTQSGTLTPSNENFNGTQTIDSGVDVAAPANYLGTIPSSPVADRIVIKDNATLRATTGFTLNPNQGILLQSGTGKLAANSAVALIVTPTLSGSGALLKTGAGNIRLTGSNTYTGGTIIEQGIIGITSDAALGAVSGTLRNLGGELVAAQTVSGGTISGVTISAARTVLIGNGTTSAFSAQTGLSLTYGGTIAEENGAGTAGNVRVGFGGAREGTVILTGSNTFQGSTLVHAGTLEIPTIADGGQASPLGRSSSAAGNLLLGNATLRFTGATGTTDRLFTLARESASTHNTTIEVTTGTLAFTNTGAIATSGTGQRSLTLAGSGAGRLAATVGNDASNNATTLVKNGSGRWTLTGNNGYTGNTEVNAGVLVLDGTNQTAGVIVAAGATLAGHGTMQAGTLSGNGVVEPGNSPGILTFLDVTASGSLSFAFEFTQANNPTWSSDTASGNDVLRLTDPDSPFNTALTATNVIDIYIGVTGPLAVGDTFRGGFFTDDNVDFYSFVQNADFNVWVRPQSGTGTRTYNGIEYVSGDQFFAPVSTFQVASADFSSGTVSNGYTLQFVAVPEPSTWVMGLMGLVGLVTPRLLRRRPTRG